MILEPGQFDLRLKQISEAFSVDKDLLNRVNTIFFSHHPVMEPHNNYTATLTRDGKGDLGENLRFIRRRTSIRLLDDGGAELWSRIVPGESAEYAPTLRQSPGTETQKAQPERVIRPPEKTAKTQK